MQSILVLEPASLCARPGVDIPAVGVDSQEQLGEGPPSYSVARRHPSSAQSARESAGTLDSGAEQQCLPSHSTTSR